jgi:hypothetical protein
MNMVCGPPQTVVISVAVGVAFGVVVWVIVDIGVIVKVGVGETGNGVNLLTAAQLRINNDRKISINKLKGSRFENCILPSISRTREKYFHLIYTTKQRSNLFPLNMDEKRRLQNSEAALLLPAQIKKAGRFHGIIQRKDHATLRTASKSPVPDTTR